MLKLILNILEQSEVTYYRNKNKKKIYKLLELFTEADLAEFINSGTIEKLEMINKPFRKSDLILIYAFIQKIEDYNINIASLEGFLILMYRILRDFKTNSADSELKSHFLLHTKNYNLLSLENLKNLLLKNEKNLVHKFIEDEISENELSVLVDKKYIVMSLLKNMRKFNRNTND